MPVHLGFVNVSPHGHKWLVDNVHNKRVWFTLLYSDSTSTQAKLYAAVELPKVIEDLTRVVISYEIYETSFRQVS